MSELTPERRAYLTAKYGINDAPDPHNPHVAAMLDGPQIVAGSFNSRPEVDVNVLFDPSRCPEMYGVARRAHDQLRRAMVNGTVEYVDASHQPYDPDDVDDAAMLVNFVGSPGICVVRTDAVEMFAEMYKATWQVTVRRSPPSRCQVRIAPVCDKATANGRSLEFLPYLCGQFLLMFPICGTCRTRAIATAETNYRFSEIAANEQLDDQPVPSWARTAPWWVRHWAVLRRALRRGKRPGA